MSVQIASAQGLIPKRNDEFRMTNVETMTKHECRNPGAERSFSVFVIRPLFVIRHSSFSPRHYTIEEWPVTQEGR